MSLEREEAAADLAQRARRELSKTAATGDWPHRSVWAPGSETKIIKLSVGDAWSWVDHAALEFRRGKH